MPLNERSKSVLKKLAAIVGIGVAAAISYEIFYWFTHVYEYDARIEAKLTTLSSRIDGEIEKVHVEEGDRVKRGDLLVALKSNVQRLKINALEADLQREKGHRTKIEVEMMAFERDLNSRLATKRETIKARKVEHATISNRYELARKNFERSKFLHRKNLTSKKSFEEEQSKVLIIEAEVEKSSANIKVAELELAEILASRLRLDVLETDKRITNLNISKIKTLIAQEKARLTYHLVRSPIDGIIDSVYKYKGEHVEEAERMILLHDENSLWIQANVDESQLRHLELGQGVVIDIDAYPYPFQEFDGIVTHIGTVTTSEMVGENGAANGRVRKPTQRIPVRIKILDPPKKIAPGMRVEVNIQIYDQIRF